MSRIVLEILIDRGVQKIIATNRTHGRVVKIAEKYPAVEAINFGDLQSAVRTADVIISATSTPHYLLQKKDFAFLEDEDCQIEHKEIIDLGVPRDIEPVLGERPEISLINLDDLAEIIERSEQKRVEEIPAAEAIVKQEFQKMKEWLSWQKVVPLIKMIGHRNQEIVESEVNNWVEQKKLTAKEKQAYREFGGRLSEKLFNRVINNLKELMVEQDDRLDLETIRKIFESSVR